MFECYILEFQFGDLANGLMHPSFKVEKEYEVTIKQTFDARLLPKLLARGFRLEHRAPFEKPWPGEQLILRKTV